MKIVLLLLVIVVAVWLFGSRRRPPADGGAGPARRKGGPGPVPMLACAHCGVHLPRDDALTDAAGQAYCSEAHRLAGPG